MLRRFLFMEEKLLQVLDKDLIVERTEIIDDIMYIYCYKNRTTCKCTYCGAETEKVHSVYIRKVKDLAIQEYQVQLMIKCNKYFCKNEDCTHKTFSEKLDFIEPNAVRTKRVDSLISSTALNNSSLNAKKQLKETNINVSKDTILRTLKKTQK